jgi:sensor histidine kinase YesM
VSLPWIPGTLAVVALALRFPLTRASWRRPLAVHLVGMAAVAFLTNVLVVIGYWVRFGEFRGLGRLVVEGARWGFVRIHVAAALYTAAVVVTQAAASRRALRERELRLARLEGQLAEARLQALSAQIRPHVLFNTLHAIGQLWRSGRADEADAMLDHLGALFQRVIASTGSGPVTLEEELAMVRDYLAIEAVRLGERLRTRFDVSEDAARCRLPALCLQPLVENAVRHGIAPLVGGGEVRIEAGVEDGRLRVRIADDGAGLSSGGGGNGLANVGARLAGLYGSTHRLRIGPAPGRGTEVVLEIPAE